MRLSEFSLRHRYTVFALILAIIFFGVNAKGSMNVELFPDTAPPLVNVVTSYPGVGAEDVASEVSETLEDEFATLDGVRAVKSTSQDALSLVKVEFNYGVDVNLAAVDVQNAVSRVGRDLPVGALEPRVLKFSTSDRPVITYAISGRGLDLTAVRDLVENEIKDKLQLVEGVAAVDIFGGYENQVNVLLDRHRMDALGLSPAQVAEALRKQNITGPGGSIVQEDKEIIIRVVESYSHPRQVEQTIVADRNGGVVRIKDVARVESATSRPTAAYSKDSTDAIALFILKKSGTNTVEVVDNVTKAVAGLRNAYPMLEFTVADDDSDFTRQVVSGMTGSIMYALVFTALIILLFIASIRESLVVNISMPMTFLCTLALMRAFDLELNMVTLSALILSVGVVVDNSIVVVENISRHREEFGKDYMQAALDGAGEITLPVLAGSATTVVVLLPLLFIEGFVGRVFAPLASTLILAILASLFISLAIIPLFTVLLPAKLLHRGDRAVAAAAGPFNRMMELLKGIYLRLLDTALSQRAATLLLALFLLVMGARLMAGLGMEVLPRMDAGTFFIDLRTPPGYSLAQTRQVVERVEKILDGQTEVVSYSTKIGYEGGARYLGESGAMSVNSAYITAQLTSRKARQQTIIDILEEIRQQIRQVPGIETFVVKESGSTAVATTSAPIDVRISGRDPAVLERLAGEVAGKIANVQGVVNIYNSWSMNSPELHVEVDEERAGALGLDAEAVTRQLFGSLEGINATELEVPQRDNVKIQVRYDDKYAGTEGDLEDVLLNGGPGISVPLRQVARVESLLGPDLVTRENGERTIDVLGYVMTRPLSQVTADIQKELKTINLPDGYQIALVGERSDLLDSKSDLQRALLVAVLGVYLVLVMQFRSFLHPLTIMSAIPLVLTGVALALILAGKPVSMPVLLGLILLAGTVVNNSILLVDHINAARLRGADRRAALLEAVATRYRPIMMTALSDVAGMLPLALELSVGSERFSPLATAVVGGILSATLLTMVVIPVIYSVLDDLARKVVYHE
ncbi:efflux RND transporter permease subunit [Desulfoscipio gibsoniae]|uniref:Cation/multidrug efflux pump n=1 Tax=Desulfoscipio gibsoniae DSM 7213 TaxID=767817 RepID=R4KLU3_9FIRM|nr:efflux RND transporter permease subunit [Desulfoscipio gibsoniae]AGL00611.1 cation/multidrug efflux pump [Desulfoscipio gibsoniae DSM 7213]